MANGDRARIEELFKHRGLALFEYWDEKALIILPRS